MLLTVVLTGAFQDTSRVIVCVIKSCTQTVVFLRKEL